MNAFNVLRSSFCVGRCAANAQRHAAQYKVASVRPFYTSTHSLSALRPPTRPIVLRLATDPSPVPAQTDEAPDSPSQMPDSSSFGRPPVFRFALYTVLVGAGTYAIAAYASVKDTAETERKIRQRSTPFGDFLSFVRNDKEVISGRVSEAQMWECKQHERADRIGRSLVKLMSICDTLGVSPSFKRTIYQTCTDLAQKYLDLPANKVVLLPILAVNTSVFLLFGGLSLAGRGRAYQVLLNTLGHRPSSKQLYSLTTSVFTHLGLIHLALNSYVMWGFDAKAFRSPRFMVDDNGRPLHTPEASLLPHFLAFFIVAGTFASFCSQVYHRVLFQLVQRRSGQLAALRTVGMLPGIGASGAVYAMVAVFALSYRDQSKIGILFLPEEWSLESKQALELMTIVESGLLILMLLAARHISPIGHSAHMGGALFGYFYYNYGNALWERCKQEAQRHLPRSTKIQAVGEKRSEKASKSDERKSSNAFRINKLTHSDVLEEVPVRAKQGDEKELPNNLRINKLPDYGQIRYRSNEVPEGRLV